MKADEAFSTLIGRIYDCALDTSLWPDVLGEITQVLNGRMGDLTVVDPITGRGHLAATYNWPNEVRELAVRHYPISPSIPTTLTCPLMEPMTTSRHLDIEAFHNSRYWQLCFAGRGYYDYLITGLTRDVTRLSGWGVLGGEERGAFEDEDIALARLLSPHIRRVLEITDMLGYQRVRAGTLRAALDVLESAAFVVSPNGHIDFVNKAAQAELDGGTLLGERKGRLVGMTTEAIRLLANLITPSLVPDQRGRDAFLREPGGRTVHITWVRLDQAREEVGSPLLVMLREPQADLNTPLGAARTLYDLTTGQTQVLAQILQGHSLPQAAQILGVAHSTVKTHLDTVFRKTDARRQTDLVRLVMGLVSPIDQKAQAARSSASRSSVGHCRHQDGRRRVAGSDRGEPER